MRLKSYLVRPQFIAIMPVEAEDKVTLKLKRKKEKPVEPAEPSGPEAAAEPETGEAEKGE